MFIGLLSSDGLILVKSNGRTEQVSLNNQSCLSRPKLINKNFNEPFNYPFTVSDNKRHTTNNPYVPICYPEKDLKKIIVTRSKYGFMINVDLYTKNQLVGDLLKMIKC